MKLLFCFFLIIVFSFQSPGQAGKWVWMNGDNTPNPSGNYGTKSVSSPANKPPGLYGPVRWIDKNGIFWIYGGGQNSYATVDDFWKFNPYINEWTWMGGSQGTSMPVYGTKGVWSPTNYPGDRGFGLPSWTDTLGNLWMFGGMNLSGNVFSDLWKYNIDSNQWIWMGGDSSSFNQISNYGIKGIAAFSNSPGKRYESVASWTDSALNKWMYGGFNGGFLNDVWKLEAFSGMWTWMAGDSLTNVFSHHGTMGVPNMANTPGGRCAVSSWNDQSGNLWIFGGNTNDTNNVQNAAGDLWKFDIHTLEWIWVNGSLATGPPGNYGPYCDALNINSWCPSGRYEDRACATDTCGNFYLYAGGAFDPSISNIWLFGDLWRYLIQPNRWELLSGNNSQNTNPHYSARGVADILNQPGSRLGSVAWFDTLNNYWMFGGTNRLDWYNDIWKFEIDSTCNGCPVPPITFFTVTDTSICNNQCINFADVSLNYPTAWRWSFPGGNPSSSSVQNPSSICYNSPGDYDVQLITSNNGGSDTLIFHNYIHVFPNPPHPLITLINDTLFCSPSLTYQWIFEGVPIPGATNSFYVTDHIGNYNVIITDQNGCSAISDSLIAEVNGLTHELSSFIYPNPVKDFFSIRIPFSVKYKTIVKLYSCSGQLIYEKTFNLKEPIEMYIRDFADGIYFVKIIYGQVLINDKIIISKY